MSKSASSGVFYKVLVYGLLTVFFSLFLLVGFVANMRQSGRTGLDAAQMQVTRAADKPVSNTSL